MSIVYTTTPSSTFGGYLISNGATSTSPTSWATASTSGTVDLTPHTIHVKGDAKFDNDVEIVGDLTIKGKGIAESLEAIEARLAILRPNEELEEKWDQLRGLRQMYMELEAEIIEKEKVWGILKK
jgi:hypothetical protein